MPSEADSALRRDGKAHAMPEDSFFVLRPRGGGGVRVYLDNRCYNRPFDDQTQKIIRIHSTGSAAWMIAFGAIVVAVGAAIAVCATGGAAAVPASGIAAVSAPAAVAILGVPTATSAIVIAFAAKSVGVLKKLRKYSVMEENGKVVLTK